MVVDVEVRRWDSLVEGAPGGDNSDDNKAIHPIEGRTIQGRNDGQSRIEELHARLKVQADFLCVKRDVSLHQSGVAPDRIRHADWYL